MLDSTSSWCAVHFFLYWFYAPQYPHPVFEEDRKTFTDQWLLKWLLFSLELMKSCFLLLFSSNREKQTITNQQNLESLSKNACKWCEQSHSVRRKDVLELDMGGWIFFWITVSQGLFWTHLEYMSIIIVLAIWVIVLFVVCHKLRAC